MSFKLHVIESTDFIRSSVEGLLDIEASRTALGQIAAVAGQHHDYHILIDLRTAKSVLTAADVWYLASELGQYGETFQRKTAILVRPGGNFAQAEFFELCAQNRGFAVMAFTDFEQAIYWMASIVQPPAIEGARPASE